MRALGGSFATLATVNYQPLTATAPGDSGATKVTLTGLDPTGIDAIRFTAASVNGGANGGAFVWRELDVFGTDTAAIPEPSSALLIGLGAFGLACRRRR